MSLFDLTQEQSDLWMDWCELEPALPVEGWVTLSDAGNALDCKSLIASTVTAVGIPGPIDEILEMALGFMYPA
ncbi:MAG: hypothetical protein AAGA68_18485 [Pseudomonadota bacterium]